MDVGETLGVGETGAEAGGVAGVEGGVFAWVAAWHGSGLRCGSLSCCSQRLKAMKLSVSATVVA